MPHDLTGVATDTTPVPAPDDGDGVTGASVENPLQGVLDRVTLALSILRVSGVYKLKSVPDLPNLKGVTGMASGDVRYLYGAGLYIFDSSFSPSGDTLPTVIKPGTGPGAWFHEMVGLFGTTSGLATIGSDNKVVQAVPRRNVGNYVAGISGAGVALSTTSSTWLSSSTAGLVLDIGSAVSGDELIISANFSGVASAPAPAFFQCRLEAVDDAAGIPAVTTFDGSIARVEGTTETDFARTVKHIVTKSGATRVRLAIRGDGADTAYLRSPLGFVVQHIRP